MKRKFLSYFYALLIFVFLYIPIIILMIMSFNKSKYNSLPFQFSTNWYSALFNNDRLINSTINSLYIAFITAIICIVLATALVLGIRQCGKTLKNIANAVVILPLTIPWIIMGLSLLLFLKYLGLDKNLFMVLMGHVVISLPYAVLVIAARMADMDKSIEEASSSLGANEWTTFRRIIFPLILPAILAGGFLSFMVSFDNFVISYFLMPTGTSTLPIEIYSSIKFGFTPEINAVSTIILSFSLVIIVLIAALMQSSLKNMFK
ncbi:inner membrane ABC transporter permease protein YdcV [Clostridium acetireducens DSM 10703]|jgi:spermidine/putrescine transport system permease protein|uniref:Inner membrane ABC transporter permease protein YdcV n=1 Tax=Clostridium acetireducens DSM 10703 TaxID=1121290 RepID=A0A1E8EW26_9CLOT|nr:ABC transporter permease [Clostridium acetireducens]OFI01471.1 inner membrane ABC transporter permease protein YdcV [Clostridium acetireducens DSM 10703]